MVGIIKSIPNIITCLNLLSGILSIIYAFNGDYRTAFILIIIAAFFDFCDGFAARLLKAYSNIGRELDSLADMVSFGLAPSIILFTYIQSLEGIHPLICYIPLILAVFSALRLAKFNIDTRQSENFIGLPTPAPALMIGALIAFAICDNSFNISTYIDNSFTLPILSVIISLLLVSEIPMFSMKIKSIKWRENQQRYTFILSSMILVILIVTISKIDWTGIVFIILAYYILWNLTAYIFNKLFSKGI